MDLSTHEVYLGLRFSHFRDSNYHRQSVSAGKINAIPTEPSGRLTGASGKKKSQSFKLACYWGVYLPREYTVNKARPQNHDWVGSVKRGV